MTNVWGVHMGEHVGNRPIDEGYVAIGSDGLGDLRTFKDRDTIKAALLANNPDRKEAAVRVVAGIAYRFANEMKAGDVVIYPSKHNRMVNIGQFTGEASFEPNDTDEYPNHRKVVWRGTFRATISANRP